MARKQLLAMTTIQITTEPGRRADPDKGISATRPKVKTIPMNARFKAMSDEQEKELIGMGAARVMSEEEVGEADHGVVEIGEEAKTAKKAADNELEAARAEYEEVFGEAPNGNMKVETMRDRIAEKKAEGDSTADIV